MSWVLSSVRIRVLVIMLAAVFALAAGETLLSKGMRQIGQEPRSWTRQAVAVARNGWVWAGCALLLVHLGLYMVALGEADLTFVLPLTAASYPLSALFAKYFLHEEVSLLRWVGMALITIGVAIVGFGEAGER
jgi:drug/metabolite transporter (DMT)-like permease